MSNVLLIDDDPNIVKLNKKYLQSKGYNVSTADCGEKALLMIEEATPDCIVLDVLLPDVMGFDLCGQIRKDCNAPIIFLSCKDHENDKIEGLLSGGDDYMTKPFSMRELEVRICTQIRRSGGVSFDYDNRIIFYHSKSILLSQMEFDLFKQLYENQNKAISSVELYAALNNGDKDKSNAIAVFIRRLRQKLEALGDDFGSIETIRGEGYRFIKR